MAMAVAGFTGGEAEELRRAMGFKRSEKRMKDIEARLRAGHGARTGSRARRQDEIVRSITSFALYGFPESHAASFALIAYASAYLKAYHPAAFVCALLNNQPMGFYHPFTLVKDAQRHGVRFRPVDVTSSGWACALEEGEVRLGLQLRARPARGGGGAHRGGAGARGRSPRSRTSWTGRGLRRDEQRIGWPRWARSTPSASRGAARSGRSRRRAGRAGRCSGEAGFEGGARAERRRPSRPAALDGDPAPPRALTRAVHRSPR